MKVFRKGKLIDVTVTLGRLEDGEKLASAEDNGGEGGEAAPVKSAKVLGMTVAELDDDQRARFEIAQGVSGVVITEVDANSQAEERGVVAGDVITEIAQESVIGPDDVLKRIEALKSQGRKNALLMLASKTGELRFITIRID